MNNVGKVTDVGGGHASCGQLHPPSQVGVTLTPADLILGVLPQLCVHGLRQSEPIRRGNTYAELRVFLSFVCVCVCVGGGVIHAIAYCKISHTVSQRQLSLLLRTVCVILAKMISLSSRIGLISSPRVCPCNSGLDKSLFVPLTNRYTFSDVAAWLSS